MFRSQLQPQLCLLDFLHANPKAGDGTEILAVHLVKQVAIIAFGDGRGRLWRGPTFLWRVHLLFYEIIAQKNKFK